MLKLLWKQYAETYCATTPIGTAIVYPHTPGMFYWEVFLGDGRSRYGTDFSVAAAQRSAHKFVVSVIEQTRSKTVQA